MNTLTFQLALGLTSVLLGMGVAFAVALVQGAILFNERIEQRVPCLVFRWNRRLARAGGLNQPIKPTCFPKPNSMR